MRNLIKVDLKRIVKDKLFLVVIILGVVFAVITPLLNKVLLAMLPSDEMAGMEGLLGSALTAKGIFFSSFMPGNNFGLIFPVFMVIILCKDFSYGTVRNKILAGKSRLQIFLAMFVATAIVTCITVLAHALIALGTSLLFFEYQATPFTASDLGYFLLSVLFEMLLYCFISAMLSCICVAMKNMGLSIVTFVAVNFFFVIVGSITTTVRMTGIVENPFVTFLDKANLFTSTVIGGGVTYGASDIAYILIPVFVGSAAFLTIGYLLFRKKDLK